MDAHAPPDAPSKSSTWPATVGVISLVVGFLSLPCCAPIGCIQNRWFNTYWDAPGFSYPMWYHVVCFVSMALGLLASFAVIIGGALLISRRRIARRLHRVYAWVTLGLGVADALVVWVGLGMSGIPADLHASLSVGAGVGLVWALVYPVFVLFWFAWGSVRSDVASWER